MSNISIRLNVKPTTVDVDPSTPLLWVVREHLQLTGTKFGCGIAQCGACTVHVDGQPTRSCVTPIAAAEGKEITTIEGLNVDGSHPLQKAWIAEQVPQCGYCQSGQIMQAQAGMPIKELCRKGGFSDATFYKWRAKYGGMDVPDAKRLRELAAENSPCSTPR